MKNVLRVFSFRSVATLAASVIVVLALVYSAERRRHERLQTAARLGGGNEV